MQRPGDGLDARQGKAYVLAAFSSEEYLQIDNRLALVDVPLLPPSFKYMFTDSQPVVQVEKPVREMSPFSYLTCEDIKSLSRSKYTGRYAYYFRHC
jgi:cellobiose-specific phosphotransferase system component IIB